MDELIREPDPDFVNLPENYGEVVDVSGDEDEARLSLRLYPPVVIPPKPVVSQEAIEKATASVNKLPGYGTLISSPNPTAPAARADAAEIAKVRQTEAELAKIKRTVLFCPGTTATGTRCGNKVVEGFNHCRHHIPNQLLEPRGERLNLPAIVNQPTFEECKIAQTAIADGPIQKGWRAVDDTLRMRHIVPGAAHETIFNPTDNLLFLLEWSGMSVNTALVKEQLQNLTFDAVILFGICIAMAIQRGQFTVAVDDLIDAIGWESRTRNQKLQYRYQIWRWLLMFDSMSVMGERRRPFLDRDAGYIKVACLSKLLTVTGVSYPMQISVGSINPPIEVTLVPGPWLDEHRGNNRIVSYFGNLRTLAQQPRGRPTAKLAVYLGFALNQKWREEASTSKVATSGSDNKPTVLVEKITRKDLLSLFGGEVQRDLEILIDGPNFKRARDTWDGAIKLLKEWGVVGFAVALSEPGQGSCSSHVYWYERQLLDIRPGETGTKFISDILAGKKRGQRIARTRQKSLKNF